MKIDRALAVSTGGLVLLTLSSQAFAADRKGAGNTANLIQGTDGNASQNPFVQPQDPALAGGGRDQSLESEGVLDGTLRADVINGRLGPDVIFGSGGGDVLLGGLEHFTANNRDRAFGEQGHDIFIWKPGDGSDFYDGGKRQDAIVFGLTGELVDDDVEFQVVNDGEAGELFIDPHTGLPRVDVTNSPGFCEIIDAGSTVDAAEQLDALGLDHLVRFSIRGVRNAFEAGEQAEDNGVRVTLHLKDVEILVCTSRDGGEIEVFDLSTSPAHVIDPRALNRTLRKRLEDIVF